jgi:hypothetical protein
VVLRHDGVLQEGLAVSPLMIVMLRMIRGGSLMAAGFVGAVLGLEGWRYVSASRPSEPGFLAVLVVLLAGFVLLARSIGRELAKTGS